MSKPKIIQAIDDLDYQGFYNKSTYLGDIRTDSTCLDTVLENGIYTFTGGLDKPTDIPRHGSYKWSLLVKSNQDNTSSIQIAERISGPSTYRQLPYYRYYSSGTWTEFKVELRYLAVRDDANNYILMDGSNIFLSTPDEGGLHFLDEGSPGSPVLAFYGNLSDELVRLTRIADPENDYDAANKKYADTKLPKSGGTMTGDLVLNADPTTDMQAATKKYVDDKSNSYKVGDILTTVRTDLDESWALCNGDYVDESQPIYNVLPDIPYADAKIYRTYDTLTYEYKPATTTYTIKLSHIIQYIDGYYILYGYTKSNNSTYHATVITTDLLGNNLKPIQYLYLNSVPDNDLFVKYNGYYLTLNGNSIYSIDFSTGSRNTYLSDLNNSYTKENMQVYNENLIVLSPNKSKLSDEFGYTLDSTNNILYTNTITYIVNNKIYAIKCKSYSDLFILDLYTYEDTSKTFTLISSSITTNIPITISGASMNALSSIYLYYVDETYYLIASRSTSNKSLISLIKSTDGNQWIYTHTIEYSKEVHVLGILYNYLVLNINIRDTFVDNIVTRLIKLSNFVDDTYVDIPYRVSRLVYNNDNHEALLEDSTGNKYITVICQGKMLPILTDSIAYNYIKIGGNS